MPSKKFTEPHKSHASFMFMKQMIWRRISPPLPISKECPFAFCTADRLDFFFFPSKPPKALCLITLWHFPHCLGLVAGLRFKNQATPFNFYPLFVQFMVCCQRHNPAPLLRFLSSIIGADIKR